MSNSGKMLFSVWLIAVFLTITGCKPSHNSQGLRASYQADLGYQWVDWHNPEEIDRMKTEFELVNPFSQPLDLKIKQMTCSCLHVDYPQSVAPKQKFKIVLSYEPRQRAETRSESVSFSTGVAELPETRFSLDVFTVPKAVIMPQKYFEKTVSDPTELTLEFDFCVYLRDESAVALDDLHVQISGGLISTIHRDKCRESDLPAGFRLWKIPVTIQGTEHLDFAVGETKTIDIRASLTDEFTATATLSVKFLGRFTTKPRQLFLPDNAGGTFEVTIASSDSSPVTDVETVIFGGEELAPDDWRMENQDKHSVQLKIEKNALQKVFATTGQIRSSLCIQFKEGKVSIPVLKF